MNGRDVTTHLILHFTKCRVNSVSVELPILHLTIFISWVV